MPARYEILWTGPALFDLRSIRDYVTAEGRPAAAKRLAKNIRDAILRLQSHPFSGRAVPEFPAIVCSLGAFLLLYAATRRWLPGAG